MFIYYFCVSFLDHTLQMLISNSCVAITLGDKLSYSILYTSPRSLIHIVDLFWFTPFLRESVWKAFMVFSITGQISFFISIFASGRKYLKPGPKSLAVLHLRNYSKVLTGPEVTSPLKASDQSDLPQMVLESLFNISKSPEHEPTTMNWRNVVKKLQTLGPRFDVSHSSNTEPQQDLCGIQHFPYSAIFV